MAPPRAYCVPSVEPVRNVRNVIGNLAELGFGRDVFGRRDGTVETLLPAVFDAAWPHLVAAGAS